MVTFLYENDLREMKLIILSSPLHEQIISALCEQYGFRRQVLRRKLMDVFDMSFLENIPARYQVWETGETRTENELERTFGAVLLTRQIPLLTEEEMNAIIQTASEKIAAGQDQSQAIDEGMTTIREIIAS